MSRRTSHGIQARQAKGREEPGTRAALGKPVQLGWRPGNDPVRGVDPCSDLSLDPQYSLKDNLAGTPVIPELQRR